MIWIYFRRKINHSFSEYTDKLTWKVCETLKISTYHPFLTQHIPPECLVFFFLCKMREEMNKFQSLKYYKLYLWIYIHFFLSVSYLFCYIQFKMFKIKSYTHSKNSFINSSTNLFITILKKTFLYLIRYYFC